jgi:hypothetical protein
VLGLLLGHSWAALSPSVSTFIINPNFKDTISVQLEDTYGTTVGCKLDYDTSATTDSSKKYSPASEVVDQITKKYDCLTLGMGIFKYKVCLGKSVDQVADNGDTYSLGKYEGKNDGSKPTQAYSDGTFCQPAQAARRSVVEFSCSERKPQIMSIDEPSTCVYRIIIGVPEVCGHPQFQAVSKVESWVLEVQESNAGEFICQAYNNGYDVIGTTSFTKFVLAFTNDLTLTKHTVRGKNRRTVDEESINVADTGISINDRVQIDYAKIVAE